MNEAGFIEAIESHMREIADGLGAGYLPDADKDVLRETGSPNPEVELRSLVYRAKAWLERGDRQARELDLHQELGYAEEKLKDADDSFDKLVKAKQRETSEDVPEKTRRWFKGLGQVAQGAVLSIANVALAIGTLRLPVSPETQTWGETASVATGIRTVLSGIGDLHNE